MPAAILNYATACLFLFGSYHYAFPAPVPTVCQMQEAPEVTRLAKLLDSLPVKAHTKRDEVALLIEGVK